MGIETTPLDCDNRGKVDGVLLCMTAMDYGQDSGRLFQSCADIVNCNVRKTAHAHLLGNHDMPRLALPFSALLSDLRKPLLARLLLEAFGPSVYGM